MKRLIVGLLSLLQLTVPLAVYAQNGVSTGSVTGPGTGVSYVPPPPAQYPFTFEPVNNINPVMTGAKTPTPAYGWKDPVVYVDNPNDTLALYATYGGVYTGNLTPIYVGYANTAHANALFDFSYVGIAIAPGGAGTIDQCGAFSPATPYQDNVNTWHLVYTAVKDRLSNSCATGYASSGDAPWNIADATAPTAEGPWTKTGTVLDGAVVNNSLDPWVVPASQSRSGQYELYVSQSISGKTYRGVTEYTSPTGLYNSWTRVGIVFDPQVNGSPVNWLPNHDVENPVVFQANGYWFLIVDDSESTVLRVEILTNGGVFADYYPNQLSYLNYGNNATVYPWDGDGSDAMGVFTLNGRLFGVYQALNNSVPAVTIGVAQLGASRQGALPAAFQSSNPLVSGSAPSLYDFNLTAIATPSAPGVVATGSGSTTYTYQVQCFLEDGSQSYPSGTTSVTNASTLNSTTNYNTITMPAGTGKYCDVWRTAGGATTGKITYHITPFFGYKVVDTGLTGDSTTTNAWNSTGGINITQGFANDTWVNVTASGSATGVLGLYNINVALGNGGIISQWLRQGQTRWYWGQNANNDDFFIERHTGSGTNQGTDFGVANADGTVYFSSVAFASLPSVPAAGHEIYCNNCTTAATCASGGSGHMAVSNGTNWTCQ